MTMTPLQLKAFKKVAEAVPFGLDATKIIVAPGAAYCVSPIKVHDYGVGVMAAFGSVVEHLGVLRGLPAQTMKLDRRRAGLLMNSAQIHFLNGYSSVIDQWVVGPDNGTYRAKDGRHVTMIGLHPHLRDGLLDYFQCANTQASIQAAVEKKPAQQIEDEVNARMLPLGVVRTAAEWQSHPQGRATGELPLFTVENKGGSRKRHLGNARHRPLEGVRVLELSHVIAGPTIGRLLAEQGADVIKVQPPNGDWLTPVWLDVSWGKKNILLDIKNPTGKRRFVELLAGADVLLSGLRRDALPRLGFDDAALRALNPSLIFGELNCFAATTPWEGRRGFEQIAQAVTGVIDAHSKDLPAPTVTSVVLNDTLTAYQCAAGIVAALAEREIKGGYWRVEASLSRCSMEALNYLETGAPERYVPLTMKDLIDHGIDQGSPWGTWTRIASAVEFSHSPSMALRPTSWPGTDPDTIGWSEVSADAPSIPHYPSKLAREGGIRNLIPGYGIEDRGDGGGDFSLASKALPPHVVRDLASLRGDVP